MKPQIPDKENACAVIVTYNPDADFAARAKQVCQQVAAVVVVDNGSAGGAPEVPGAAVIASGEIIRIPQ